MKRYSYTAVNEVGKKFSGSIEAANEVDLETRVERMGMSLIQASAERPKTALLPSRKVTTKEIIDFTLSLEQLVKAGVPIIESLMDIRDGLVAGKLRETLSTMIEHIQSGMTLSKAMEPYGDVFGKIYVSTVEVGERSGSLSAVLGQLAEDLKWQDELLSKAKQTMRYPMFVMLIVMAVIMGLMTYTVPQMVSFLSEFGQELPWPTRALIATSDFFVAYWWVILSLPVGLYAVLVLGRKSSRQWLYWTDGLWLKLPIIGPLSLKMSLARFTKNFSLMYRSGITVLDSVMVGKDLMNNAVLEDAMERVYTQISEGSSIGDGFAQTGLFPSIVVRMMRVGEQSGNLNESLDNVTYFYTREIREAVEKMESSVIVYVTVMLAVPIIAVIVAIFFPIYDSLTQIGAF